MPCLRKLATQGLLTLYNNYRRETSLLPDYYLRHFYLFKLQNDLNSVLETTKPQLSHLRQRKIKRVQRDLRRIQNANAGHGQAFESILETAYGRKGRLRRELMQPLTNEPNKPQPLHPGVAMSAPLVSEVKKLRYPLFMGPIISLLTSPYSKHTGSVLKPQYIDAPPSLPPQYNPHSVEAKYLGPLSKRRERNIRHKYFVSQINKIYTPLRVDLGGAALADVPPPLRNFVEQLPKGSLEGIERITGSTTPRRNLTRRERDAGLTLEPQTERHPSRWLRRRYQHLLAQTPILTYDPVKKTSTISPHPKAVFRAADRSLENKFAVVDEESSAWLRLASAKSRGGKKR